MRTIKFVTTPDGNLTISYKEFLLLKDNFSVYKDSKRYSNINGHFTKGQIYNLIFNSTKHENDYINSNIFLDIVNEFILDCDNPFEEYMLDKLNSFLIKDEIELRKDKIKEFIINGE